MAQVAQRPAHLYLPRPWVISTVYSPSGQPAFVAWVRGDDEPQIFDYRDDADTYVRLMWLALAE